MLKPSCRLVVLLGTLCVGGFSVAECRAQEAPTQEAPQSEANPESTDGHKAGHSYHGHVFNEGPRQAAYLMEGTGNVHFPATCKSEHVQKLIDQGVGQLHGFWYFESERTFRQAAALDPDCAMAYWGMAMSNRGNEDRARGFIEQAVQRKDKVSDREKKYIDAAAEFFKKVEKPGKDHDKQRRQKVVDAYETLVIDDPEDVEAKAFLTLWIYENKAKGIEISSYLAVDALIGEVLAVNRLHPAHHFRIHLWDYKKPEKALESAALCGESAPAIAHMWHMPGHIYSRLKRYHDAVWQQEASARVDHAHMMRDRVLPDQIHNFAHNNEWLIRNLISIGRAHDALDLSLNMISLPRHPKFNTLDKQGTSTTYGRLRLHDVLTNYEMWPVLLKLHEADEIELTDKPEEQVKWKRAIGVAKYETGDFLGGCAILMDLKTRLTEIRGEQAAAEEKAIADARQEKKSEDDVKKAGDKARQGFEGRIRPLENAITELEGLLHRAGGAPADALASLKKVNDPLNPMWVPLLQLQVGETDAAVSAIKKHASSAKNEVAPMARSVEVLWLAGRKEEAGKQFEELRKIGSSVDLDLPIVVRLAPIARELGLPVDWRLPREIPADFGSRPDLTSLGPFRWSPSPARPWSLKNQLDQTVSLGDYTGRNVLVIFYLGHGCLHCAEQLQAFAPKTEEFRKAGIEIVAISSDSIADLKLSQDNYDPQGFPFPLVSDQELKVFKAYRCFDDFENLVLHGTFLIDSQGLVRWQDISFEPFMNVDFALQEAKRLLHQKPVTRGSPDIVERSTGE